MALRSGSPQASALVSPLFTPTEYTVKEEGIQMYIHIFTVFTQTAFWEPRRSMWVWLVATFCFRTSSCLIQSIWDQVCFIQSFGRRSHCFHTPQSLRTVDPFRDTHPWLCYAVQTWSIVDIVALVPIPQMIWWKAAMIGCVACHNPASNGVN